MEPDKVDSAGSLELDTLLLPSHHRHGALATAIFLAAIALLPTLGYGLGFDHGFMEYGGWAMLHGRWPYQDFFDTSFPGVYLLHALVIAIGGRSVLALRLADFALQLGTATLLFSLTRRIAGPRAGIIASAMYAIGYTAGTYYHTAERDAFLLPFLLGAVWNVWRFLDEPSRRQPLLWSAACAGIVCLFRPTYALAVVLSATALAVYLRARGPTAVVDALVFTTLAATPILAFFALYVVSGHRHALTDLLLVDATVYPYTERQRPIVVLYGFWSQVPKLLWVGTALAVVAIVSGAYRTRRREMATIALVFGCCVLVRLWESHNYRYQYWPAVVCLAVFAGIGWDALIAKATERSITALGPILPALLLLISLGRSGLARYPTIVANLYPTGEARYDHIVADSHDQALLASFLAARLGPDERLQLWGPETVVLYATQRFSATRILDPVTFVCPAAADHSRLEINRDCRELWDKPIQVALQRELMDSLTARPPRYIAAHYADGTTAIELGYTLAPDWPPLRALLDRQYIREATFGAWSAFRRVDP